MAETQPCMLYYDPKSICSSMVRYTIANAGAPAEGSLPLAVEPKIITLFQGEQFTEFYLCEVNPKGQVPVLVSPGFFDKPIADSLDITFWLCDRFPGLRPAAHAKDISRLLIDLHAINFFTLSMRNTPFRAHDMEKSVQERLAQPGISDRYRRALEFKATVVQEEKVDGLKPEVIEAEMERTKAVLNELDTIRKSNNQGEMDDAWVFGTKAPTALDTTLVCLLVRLIDVKLEELVPQQLLDLARRMQETEAFKEIWMRLG